MPQCDMHLCFNLGQNLDFEQLEDSNRVPCSIFRWQQSRTAVLVQFSCKALKQDHLCDILFCKYSVIFLFCKNSVTFFFCKYFVIFFFGKYSVTFFFSLFGDTAAWIWNLCAAQFPHCNSINVFLYLFTDVFKYQVYLKSITANSSDSPCNFS